MTFIPGKCILRAGLVPILLLGSAPMGAQIAIPSAGIHLPEPPQVQSVFALSAVNDPVTGRAAFSFAGHQVAPTIRAAPGEKIHVEYRNEMSTHSPEICVDGPCMNMTNLHFHGLHVSPNAPQDDVISMMAMPGETLHYVVDIPKDQPPGLYWYHTHPHGESYQQALDGMSGAIIIEGIDRYVPEVRSMKEQLLILRDQELRKAMIPQRRLGIRWNSLAHDAVRFRMNLAGF